MLITSHILGTLVLSKALSLQTPELYVALLAGVGVDLDHFFVNKKWVKDVKDFVWERKITYGVKQHSWLQEFSFGAMAGTLIGIATSYICPSIRWWIFPLFLLAHILLDSIMQNEHQPFAPFHRFKYYGWLRSGTKEELLLSFLGLLVLYFE